MVCHGELYRLRPASGGLTGYYLTIAAGGAAGSLFVSLGGPLLFSDYRELQLGLVLLLYFTGVLCWHQRSRTLALGLAAGLLATPIVLPLLRADAGVAWSDWFVSAGREILTFATAQWLALGAGAVVLFFALRRNWRRSAGWHPRLLAIPGLLTVSLAIIFVQQAREDNRGTHEASRNFYGAYKVLFYDPTPEPETHFLLLANGGITHGLQFLGGPLSAWATTYYSPKSGLGRAFAALPEGPRHVGAVGLGTGTLAVHGRRGDSFRFYEINPAIADTASRTFTYLKHSPATIDVVLGDARLVLEREVHGEHPLRFDLLVLDAFSGDAIPVHLLTREALQLYLRVLRPGGIIAVHISNRHLDLRPVVEGLAVDAGLHFATLHDTVAKADWWLYDTDWVLLSADPSILEHESIRTAAQEPPDADAPMIVWTDDHASLLEIVK
jgi:SAM-dependent methyltransferase